MTITITQSAKVPEEQEPVFEYEAFIEPDNTDMRAMSALELSALMGAGWNLGNSLEAITVNNGIFTGGETSWGNPATTKGLIDAVKAAGFNTIRIPVAWSHKLADKENHLINLAWLQR
ncbi:endo-1,4-beta-xylanase A precursor [Geofilum rubicundum JCM 15548]|uniref:Endo-1,4-beta-xylanase A n=1 Tax=Geofilum rubicundum JCM 15548 TaxID=1236989 RepID=A0A0E9LY37_9BACT|nr:endo-1,4-beta-xylanase A precursor [Geofilum rubicundum JCM 15548]